MRAAPWLAVSLAVCACGPAPEVRTSTVDGLEYIRIPSGAFQRGCVESDTDCQDDEKPARRLEIGELWLGRTEVTVPAFRRFVAATGYRTTAESDGWSYVLEARIVQKTGVTWAAGEPGAPENAPVTHVSWYDAAAYCSWVGGALPTEAQWEYAARGGKAGGRYVWGDSALPFVGGASQANVWDEAARRRYPQRPDGFVGYDDGFLLVSPAGRFAANGFGLHDLAGNVLEWCADWYNKPYYATAPERDPSGAAVGSERVLRGGSWNDGPKYLRVSDRFGFTPGLHNDVVGFRCARSAPP